MLLLLLSLLTDYQHRPFVTHTSFHGATISTCFCKLQVLFPVLRLHGRLVDKCDPLKLSGDQWRRPWSHHCKHYISAWIINPVPIQMKSADFRQIVIGLGSLGMPLSNRWGSTMTYQFLALALPASGGLRLSLYEYAHARHRILLISSCLQIYRPNYIGRSMF